MLNISGRGGGGGREDGANLKVVLKGETQGTGRAEK